MSKHFLYAGGTILVIATMSSCTTVGPNYQRPDLGVPGGFKSATAADLADPRLGQNWWTLFRDDTLNGLVEEGLDANQDVQAAMARVDQARATTKSVRSSFYPVLTMNPSAMRSGSLSRLFRNVPPGGVFTVPPPPEEGEL